MVKVLFDTNILIDFLKGLPEAQAELNLHPEKAISIVSWMEVMAGTIPSREGPTRAFLNRFEVIHLDQTVADAAASFRRDMRIKLPDAIIWGSAACHSLLIVTRNTKDFPADHPGVRVPYLLQ